MTNLKEISLWKRLVYENKLKEFWLGNRKHVYEKVNSRARQPCFK